MKKVDCIIQARLGSERLPGKVLLELSEGKTLLDYLFKQLKFCKLIKNFVIATTILPEDDKIVKFAEKNKIDFFRGSSDDVLDRFYQCAKNNNFKNILRITADNPLIDPTIIDLTITKFFEDNLDYISNHIPRTFPQGTESEIFSFNSLEVVWKNALKKSEREHVTPYFYSNPKLFRIGNLQNPKNFSFLRWSVDRKNDFLLVQKIISEIKKEPILMNDILELYENKKSLFELNKDHIVDEGYKKSLAEENF